MVVDTVRFSASALQDFAAQSLQDRTLIVHAGQVDLELLAGLGVEPARVFDTQARAYRNK